jgi:hypothetical protein
MSIYTQTSAQSRWRSRGREEAKEPFWINLPLLLIVALVADLLLPFLIWKRVMPGSTRWISDLVVAALLVLSITRMLAFNRIPGALFFMIAISAIGATVAHYEDQAWAATAWGWWNMFRYPLLGLYTYLHPKWPQNMADRFVYFCVAVMTFEVLVQLGQFATGEVPGDNLAGSFGRHGVGSLVTFTVFVLALAWGRWLTDGNWKIALYVTILGLIASALGEIKFYPVGMVAIVFLALVIHAWRTGRISDLFVYSGVIAALIVAFGFIYNTLVSDVRGTRRLEEFLEWETTEGKLNGLFFDPNVGIYRFGRGFAVTHGWETIQGDPVTMLFGLGLGARSESVSLGIMGVGFQRDGYGLTSSPSSLTFLQELGLGGIAAFLGFFLWVSVRLLAFAGRRPSTGLTTMSYGLAIFTLLWPLWIFNHNAWGFSVAQILYWSSLGFVFSQINLYQTRPLQRRAMRLATTVR